MEKNIIKSFLIVFFIGIANGCVAENTDVVSDVGICEKSEIMESFYGVFHFKEMQRYSGGILKNKSVEDLVKRPVTIQDNNFSIIDIDVQAPSYKLICERAFVEGNVSSNRTSLFYGFGSERNEIHLVEVYKEGHLVAVIEIYMEEIWFLFDGWLIKYRKLNNESEKAKITTTKP